MIFQTKLDSEDEGTRALTLSQRGRAGIQLLGSLQKYSSSVIRSRARRDFEADRESAPLADDPDLSWPRRLRAARTVAERSRAFRLERFLQRVVAEEVFNRGIPALEERRERFEPLIRDSRQSAGGTLELDETVVTPSYYDGIEWHLEPGGWDGYDLYGPMFAYAIGPYVFSEGGYAAVEAGDDIVAQRAAFVAQLPDQRYERIYEPGCGGFTTLAAAHKAFPDAELTGSDISPGLLRTGHIFAENAGVRVHFRQRDARATREPENRYDAVLMYALLHEMPPSVGVEVLREAFRILSPGGALVISDPPPFRAVPLFQAVLLDWDTKHREEPFFSAACRMDWGRELDQLGFDQVEAYALGEHGYPWITRARKPLSR